MAAQSKHAPDLRSVNTVFLEGRPVDFRPLNGASIWTLLHTSTAKIAHMLRGKPRDGRPNLYIVAPGKQMRQQDEPGFDHNLVISSLPLRPEPTEFDIYYAIILDPALREDLQSERDIILARQQVFQLADGFKFTDIPGVTTLRVSLSIRTLADLDGFRRADGALPRLIVVSSRMALSAVVQELPPLEATNPVPPPTMPETTVSAGSTKEAPSPAPAPRTPK